MSETSSSPSTVQFTSLSNAIAGVVASASRSVVTVNGRRRRPASGVVWSADGLIVTANHVVERDENVTVVLPAGEVVEANIIGRDPAIDLALLRIDHRGLDPASWAAAGDLQVGQLTLALARPNGAIQASLGAISSLGGPWLHRGGGRFDLYLQADVTMYPGFSGGPLVTAGGAFAGINSSALARGVSLAVPASSVEKSVAALLAHGRIPRAYLGVGVQKVPLQAGAVPNRAAATALMIMSVEADTPAAGAGLLQGDILLALQDQELTEVEDLQNVLAEITQPTIVQAHILRGGATQSIAVELTVR